MRQIFGASADNAHRGADLMRESGGQAADGGEAVGMQQPSFQLDLAAMFFQQIRARFRELLAQLAEFADQQFDLIFHRLGGIERRGRSSVEKLITRRDNSANGREMYLRTAIAISTRIRTSVVRPTATEILARSANSRRTSVQSSATNR